MNAVLPRQSPDRQLLLPAVPPDSVEQLLPGQRHPQHRPCRRPPEPSHRKSPSMRPRDPPSGAAERRHSQLTEQHSTARGFRRHCVRNDICAAGLCAAPVTWCITRPGQSCRAVTGVRRHAAATRPGGSVRGQPAPRAHTGGATPVRARGRAGKSGPHAGAHRRGRQTSVRAAALLNDSCSARTRPPWRSASVRSGTAQAAYRRLPARPRHSEGERPRLLGGDLRQGHRHGHRQAPCRGGGRRVADGQASDQGHGRQPRRVRRVAEGNRAGRHRRRHPRRI